MASVIGATRPQWTGGCQYFTDPLRGLDTSSGLIRRSNVRRSFALFRGPARGVVRRPKPLGISASRNTALHQTVANNRWGVHSTRDITSA
jgi:hypothetical protein